MPQIPQILAGPVIMQVCEIPRLHFASRHVVLDAKAAVSGVSENHVFWTHSPHSLLRTKAVTPSPSGARAWHVGLLVCHWKALWHFMVHPYLKGLQIWKYHENVVELWTSAIRTPNCGGLLFLAVFFFVEVSQMYTCMMTQSD